MLGDLVGKAVSKLTSESKESKPKPKIVAYIRKEEGIWDVLIKNIGNETAVRVDVTCLTFASRNLPERKISEKEFSELYPFAEREFTLIDVAPVDKKLVVVIKYESPTNEKYSAKQEFRLEED